MYASWIHILINYIHMNYILYLLFKNIFICSQKFNGTMKYTIRQKKKYFIGEID